MRDAYPQLLENIGFSVSDEYEKLRMLYLNGGSPLYSIQAPRQIISDAFTSYAFRGTCLTLDEYESKLKVGRYAERYGPEATIDDLITLSEHIVNLVDGTFSAYELQEENYPELSFLLDQIDAVIDRAGFIGKQNDDGVWFFIENDAAVINAASLLDVELAERVFVYTHHALEGNIEDKQAILQGIAKYLEPNMKKLSQLNSGLKDDLGYMFNNLNIRHNNLVEGSKAYNEELAAMSDDELEQTYDVLYRMCLCAILTLDCAELSSKVVAPLKTRK